MCWDIQEGSSGCMVVSCDAGFLQAILDVCGLDVGSNLCG